MKRSQHALDINLLPPELRRPFFTPRGWFFLVIAVVIAFSYLPLFNIYKQASGEVAQLKQESRKLKLQEVELRKLEPKVESLNAAIAETAKKMERIKKDYEFFLDSHISLIPVLRKVVLSLPAQVHIYTLSYKSAILQIEGASPELSLLSQYIDRLDKSGLFDQIIVSFEKKSEEIVFSLSLKVRAGIKR